eukprot:CAMPEP_0204253492 /NCGR_PEP_ID=MMETSP0468-20130131/1901_1 /ASSEMBLY_ACC=CAM_ASM_000383 /TAXON_ID=2969 /ORGANISM="Oxyrrhis marina" /LENGTH=222 /DNA_ID=CAMNT_0051227069 /DNA_START=183 /DNA_END=851 /DNA_ORIENTATION=-
MSQLKAGLLMVVAAVGMLQRAGEAHVASDGEQEVQLVTSEGRVHKAADLVWAVSGAVESAVEAPVVEAASLLSDWLHEEAASDVALLEQEVRRGSGEGLRQKVEEYLYKPAHSDLGDGGILAQLQQAVRGMSGGKLAMCLVGAVAMMAAVVALAYQVHHWNVLREHEEMEEQNEELLVKLTGEAMAKDKQARKARKQKGSSSSTTPRAGNDALTKLSDPVVQ